jgi:2'-5' RNA ligase
VGQLRIGRGGGFPSQARGRVLVAHIEGEQPALAGLSALAASVAAGARRAGAPPPDEGRKYRPHLTLARSRQPAHLGGLVEALALVPGRPWSPAEIHLIRSQLGPRPAYQTLATWPLGKGNVSDLGVEDPGGARDVLD